MESSRHRLLDPRAGSTMSADLGCGGGHISPPVGVEYPLAPGGTSRGAALKSRVETLEPSSAYPLPPGTICQLCTRDGRYDWPLPGGDYPPQSAATGSLISIHESPPKLVYLLCGSTQANCQFSPFISFSTSPCGVSSRVDFIQLYSREFCSARAQTG